VCRGIQVQASCFAKNLHPPLSDSIFRKKLACPRTLPFHATKTTTTDTMERRITLNNDTMKKKNENYGFENSVNEKQNSLSSRIRIGLGGNFPVFKQQFIRIREVEYATDFDFFIRNQVHVVHHTNGTTSICSSLENRCFRKDNTSPLDEETIMKNLGQIHRDIITFKYGGKLVY
jgi:hypothetical protein